MWRWARRRERCRWRSKLPREHPLWVMRQAQARRLEGDPAGGLAMLEAAIGKSEIAPLPLLRRRCRPGCAAAEIRCVARLARALVPAIARYVRPVLTTLGSATASDYAYVLRELGDRGRAAKVLDAYLIYVASRPRLGFLGFGIGDVEALALSGKRDEALARLREAVDAGWRSPSPGLGGWTLAEDPYLDSLRDDVRFRAIVAEVDADIARMRERAAAVRGKRRLAAAARACRAGRGTCRASPGRLTPHRLAS